MSFFVGSGRINPRITSKVHQFPIATSIGCAKIAAVPRIKVARAEVNITQGELAEKIGVTRQAVNSIELGKYVPSTLLALKMARRRSAGIHRQVRR